VKPRSLGVLGGSALAAALRRQFLRWGATPEEVDADLPGDELLPRAHLTATRAITIRAAPREVWPWIAQLGQGRGGFYSYDALENLFGCDISSADRIVPEWQHVTVGQEVKLHPEAGLVVARVEPGHALVLRGGVPMGAVPPPYDFSWAFVVRGSLEGPARLLVRERYAYARWWAGLLVEPVAVISLVMSRRMLHGLKERAERAAGAGPRGEDR
jgi:hypothetical protein